MAIFAVLGFIFFERSVFWLVYLEKGAIIKMLWICLLLKSSAMLRGQDSMFIPRAVIIRI